MKTFQEKKEVRCPKCKTKVCDVLFGNDVTLGCKCRKCKKEFTYVNQDLSRANISYQEDLQNKSVMK